MPELTWYLLADDSQLAIVLTSIPQHASPIGLGNIIGSAISNILGGLAIAMLVYPGTMTFDSCAKFYSSASFVASSVFLLIHYTDGMDFTGGLFYVVFFFVYVFAVGLAIYEGYLTMPVIEEDSSIVFEEANSFVSSPVDIVINVEPPEPPRPEYPEFKISMLPSVEVRPSVSSPLLGTYPIPTPPDESGAHLISPSEVSSQFGTFAIPIPTPDPHPLPSLSRRQTMGPIRTHTFKSLRTVRSSYSHDTGFQTICFHITKMVIGFLAVSLSGFVLSYASASLANNLHISQFVFGLTILSIFSTIPEKCISVIAGLEGDSSLLVASIAGSNVFLLTLCIGILLVTGGEGDADKVLVSNLLPFEVWVTWGSSILLMIIVWVGGRRWMGGVLLMLYIAFHALELTVYRR